MGKSPFHERWTALFKWFLVDTNLKKKDGFPYGT